MTINKTLLFLSIITIIGCTRKTVQIPVLKISGIKDTIYDNSQIWIFSEQKDGDTIATLNRKNSIATTSWIYNIDKSLPMYLVVPHLQKLTEKREKPALHEKGEDDFNYFSYVDSSSDLLSMVKFDVIYFNTKKSIDFNQYKNDTLNKHLILNYRENELSVNDSLVSLDDLNMYFDQQSNKKLINVHLNFDRKLKYQNYLELKAQLQNVQDIKLDSIEYVN